jgi:hypothetical protein
MANLAGYGELLGVVNGLYWVVAALFTWWAWRKPTTQGNKAAAAAFVATLFLILPVSRIYSVGSYKWQYNTAKALFEERCKTAGEKIYRTVEDVEGIVLVNPLGRFSLGNLADRDWIGAGFPHESGGNHYIMEFLYFNEPASGNRARGLGWIRKGLQGYPYLDIEEQGTHFRYRLVAESDYKNLGDPVKDYGSKEIVTTDYPRYAVTYDNIPDPEGRANWVAGGRVTVVDRATNELLGEFVR